MSSSRTGSPHRLPPRDRPPSRSSVRSHSPSYSADDPVHVRNQISTLRHSIRHQQAQLHSLENIIRAGPRPMSMSPDDLPSPPTAKARRRSSYDVLQGIAGPDSNLPLPKRGDDSTDPNGTDVIREGIPTSFATPGLSALRRPSSPTRSLSRIPVAAVGNAKALADDGQIITPVRQQAPPPIHKSHSATDLSGIPGITSTAGPDSSFSSLAPPSPSLHPITSLNPPPPSPRRLSSTPGGTTKVLADLQAGVINARNALENTKSQLRLSQRTVASLTRKVEDLKEVEERLRIENEGLNNVVARKERLLQEVLERARKAEAEATTLKQQLKQETSTSKKTIREMEAQLSESTTLSKKSEREYITLRDSIKGMVESWKHDTDALRAEMKKREERCKKEVDGVGKKYRDLVQNVKEREKIWEEEFKRLRENDRKMQKEVEEVWSAEIKRLEDEVGKSGSRCEKASRTADDLALELAILKKRMKSVRIPRADGQRQEDGSTSLDTDSTTNTAASNSAQQENVPP